MTEDEDSQQALALRVAKLERTVAELERFFPRSQLERRRVPA